MWNERFYKKNSDFPDTNFFFVWTRIRIVYRFCMDPDSYQSSAWIRIRYEICQMLDPDHHQNYTDPQHCLWG